MEESDRLEKDFSTTTRKNERGRKPRNVTSDYTIDETARSSNDEGYLPQVPLVDEKPVKIRFSVGPKVEMTDPGLTGGARRGRKRAKLDDLSANESDTDYDKKLVIDEPVVSGQSREGPLRLKLTMAPNITSVVPAGGNLSLDNAQGLYSVCALYIDYVFCSN